MRSLVSGCALLLLMSACAAPRPTIQMAQPEVTATVSKLRVRHRRWGDIVRGDLTVRGTSRTLLTANIECFALQVAAASSTSIFVDSWIYVIPFDYPAKDGTLSVPVYWAMKDFKTATDAGLRDATLSIYNRTLKPCFELAP